VTSSGFKTVIFDLGGVVLGSPLHAIARFEKERGIPDGFVNRLVVETAPDGAWSRLERGELSIEEFYRDFDAECVARGHLLPAVDMMEAIHTSSGPRPEMLKALERLREYGLTTAALTNNWKSDGQDRHDLRPYFDVFIESSVVGLRKPDPRIYELALERIGVTAEEAVFLDDIGGNLKTARAMGITTIKVVDAASALAELGATLSVEL
jgi:putative hydrolase of the HAD superfamily